MKQTKIKSYSTNKSRRKRDTLKLKKEGHLKVEREGQLKVEERGTT